MFYYLNTLLADMRMLADESQRKPIGAYLVYYGFILLTLFRFMIAAFCLHTDHLGYFHYDAFFLTIYKVGMTDSILYFGLGLITIFYIFCHYQIYFNLTPMIWCKLDELVIRNFDQLGLRLCFSPRVWLTMHSMRRMRKWAQFVKAAWSNGDAMKFAAMPSESQLSHLTKQNRARIVLLWIALESGSQFLVLICKFPLL